MSEDTPPERPFVRHPVFIAWGGLNLRLSDQGITPQADAMRFTRGGRLMVSPYTDIVEINLMMTAMPKAADVAQMTIRFRNGMTMRVLNTNAWGNADADQTQHYYRLKADLHERLVESGAAQKIRFSTGATPGRARFLKVALGIAAAFFIGTPIVIFLMTGQAQALLICLGGAAFVLPFFRASQRNAPGRYDPRHPPDMLA
jgi:hypothetical protein